LRPVSGQEAPRSRAAFVYYAVALPTKGDIRAQDFDAAEAGCSIGGASTAVVSISSPLLITR
jgi:hypothetical protein